MKNRSKIIIVFSIGLLAPLLAFVLHTSLWYSWAITPPGDLKVAFNQTRSGSDLVRPALSAWLSSSLGEDLDPILSLTRRLAVSQSADRTIITVIPRQIFLGRSNLFNHFESIGFTVQRHGLLVIASQGDALSRPSTIQAGTKSLINSFTKYRRPFLVARAHGGILPLLNDPVTLVGIGHRKSDRTFNINLVGQTGLKNPARIASTVIPITQSSANLSVSLPSQLLAAIPISHQEIWDLVITSQLGLTKTNPDIFSALSLGSHQAIHLAITENSTTLTTLGSPADFINHVRSWVQTEVASARPKPHGFRLPDNTVGFEYTPSDPAPVFESAASGLCEVATWSDEISADTIYELWLCREGDYVTLGTAESSTRLALENASQYLNPDQANWSLQLNSTFSRLFDPALESLIVTGDLSSFNLTATLTRQQ